jgi:serine/threonine protein kinase
MSVPSSVEELLQLIRKSGMIEDAKLTAYLQRGPFGRGLPDDPRDAANLMIEDGILTEFQAEQYLLGKWRGFTVGKYKLLERVGVGGMGQVFLCEHLYMKRRVAIKVLPPAKAEQPAALGRFYREARAAGALEHPNIVRTHDIDQDGNLHFIVMEYVEGSNLLDMVKKSGPMDVARACHYARQVAIGLDFAFRSGIIHRDIKPGNILIDPRGVAKILDMGLARFYMDQTDMLTVKYDDKIVLGTADYVAPEQVANSHSVDVRADIYALGASLYFLLAGHPVFPSGSVSQKLLWHRTKNPTPLRQIRPEVPEEVAAIVERMMAKDPAARQQTPAEVASDLMPWVAETMPLPTEAELPKLSPAAVENGTGTMQALTGFEDSPFEEISPPRSVPISQLIKRPAMKPDTSATPLAYRAAVAEEEGPRSTLRPIAPTQSQLRPRPVAAFPPSPFAPSSQIDMPTLTVAGGSVTPKSQPRLTGRSTTVGLVAAPTTVVNRVFGHQPIARLLVFVVLLTMCATMAVVLAVVLVAR